MKTHWEKIASAIGVLCFAFSAAAEIDLHPPVEDRLPPFTPEIQSLLQSDLTDVVPQAARLQEIAQFSNRAQQWWDLVQGKLPVERRLQFWRRGTPVPDYPIPSSPRLYNEATVVQDFAQALPLLPDDVKAVLSARTPLPDRFPDEAGFPAERLLPGFKAVIKAGSYAIRFLGNYPRRSQYAKAYRDFRYYLDVARDEAGIREEISRWEARVDHSAMVDRLARLCVFNLRSVFAEPIDCLVQLGADPRQPRTFPQKLDTVLTRLLKTGKERFEERFRPFASGSVHPMWSDAGSQLTLGFFPYAVPANVLKWIAGSVGSYWHREGSLWTAFAPVDVSKPGVFFFKLQENTTPHVTQTLVMWDTVVMDPNGPLWMDTVVQTMAHEMGHIFGFPDCYSEFWDDSANAFVFYAFSRENIMCSSSGDVMDLHLEGLRTAYPFKAL
ncbi:MAG: hypothetical protein AB7F66_16565 [Bacteriovoracia bacterium]